MMDTRTLVLGLGAGMIAATLILGAGSQWVTEAPQEPKQAEPEQAETDWKKAAEQAGMVVLKKEEYEERLSQAKADGAKQKEAELQQGAAANSVFVYIQPGMGTTDVAILLQAAGVISDGNQLISLRESWPTPIRAGTYELKKNSDPKEVLKAIATPPSN
jgi:hypothetical protein